jgi:GxxExxY protein
VNRQVAKSAKKYLDEPDEELDRLAHRTIGAALAVHCVLGPGLLESVYEEALCVELTLRQIPFARQAALSVTYKHHRIGEARLDLLVGQRLVVELKAVESIVPVHVAQVLSYLKLGGYRLGILINFNVSELRRGIKRCINSSFPLGVRGGLAVGTAEPNLPESVVLETSR